MLSALSRSLGQRWGILLGMILGGGVVLDASGDEPAASTARLEVRCAVVGGLNEIDLWSELADRFQRASGHELAIVATGPKHAVLDSFRAGEADVIVMHSCDAMINLVADGHGQHLQPWARNDFVIVGPSSDPARIRGEKDAVAALKRIVTTRSKFLIPASSGASELLSDLMAAGGMEFDPQTTISLFGDRHRQILARAEAEQAYTLVGRIPFVNGKLDRGSLQILVQGDSRLRRPYLVVVSTHGEKSRLSAAERFSHFLREPATQAFLADFGRGKYDALPLLFPVASGR